jgi:hypothetical protein
MEQVFLSSEKYPNLVRSSQTQQAISYDSIRYETGTVSVFIPVRVLGGSQ